MTTQSDEYSEIYCYGCGRYHKASLFAPELRKRTAKKVRAVCEVGKAKAHTMRKQTQKPTGALTRGRGTKRI